ncbi:hypothetical protein D9757_001431 [Collybiopsis confluens]|uniref:Ankyrin n=1 Tax=Collybiopsis confluens TaxID=2823264 RepID=A0A8H5MFW0_9AGAR|nr:hypothetical protein D9757_001431 [Collybiopsis confluens]
MTASYDSSLSADKCELHAWALEGNSEGVQSSINAGANANDIDASGRSAVMCAIAGVHWTDISVAHDEKFMTPSRLQAIDTLIRQPDVSLFTLNAPQHAFNDATPLGMATWLNMDEAVRILLENTLGSVAVDGTDMHGSTPLMYAARDGLFAIAKLLLEHGARPDLRALNHRTAIQYALTQPRVLYLCETMLRRHRIHEWKAESEDFLQQTVSSFSVLKTLEAPSSSLFTSDSLLKTTCAILQHIRSNDTQALCSTLFSSYDAPLVNNWDRNGWSPIHHAASMPEPSIRVLDTLYCAGADVALFSEHEHYTALHCFAFSDHGKSSPQTLHKYASRLIHDLRAPLSARDKNGDTCIHIAASHGHSIEILQILLNFDPSHSVRDLCNAKGLTAWEAAKPQFRLAFGDAELLRPESSLSTHTLRPAQGQYSIQSYMEESPVSPLHWRISFSLGDFDVSAASHQLIDYLRISSPSLRQGNDVWHIKYLESLMVEMNQLHLVIIDHLRARATEASNVLKEMEDEAHDVTTFFDSVTYSVNAKLREQGLEPWAHSRVSEDSDLTCVSSGTKSATPSIIISDEEGAVSSSSSIRTKTTPSTKSRFVAWIKRKSSASAISKVANPLSSPPKKNARRLGPASSESLNGVEPSSVNATLLNSGITFRVVGKDLEDVQDTLVSNKQLLDSASRSISRVDRILKRALKARKTMIENLQSNAENDPFTHGSSTSLSTKASFASIISVSTITSQLSLGGESSNGILAENDDEDTRAIRRHLLRKIEARHIGMLDEIEKTALWLKAVRDIVNGVKRRTYV